MDSELTYKNCTSFDRIIEEMIPFGYHDSVALKVYDGDTAWFYIDLNGRNIRIKGRFSIINTPEIRGGTDEEKNLGKYVRDIVKEIIQGKQILIQIHDLDKYRRFLVTVWVTKDIFHHDFDNIYSKFGIKRNGKKYINLNQWMIFSGLAVPY